VPFAVSATVPTGPRIAARDLAAWRTFLAAHARIVGDIEAALTDEGLPPLGWYDVLWPLYRAPDRRLRMKELAAEVVLSRTGLVRLVDRIERAGLLRREPVPGDGRGAYAALTEDGAEMLRRMWPIYARGIREGFLDRLEGDREALRGALERLAGRQVAGGPSASNRPRAHDTGATRPPDHRHLRGTPRLLPTESW
jgi:DNA-binding MarR family transcriptional regulator